MLKLPHMKKSVWLGRRLNTKGSLEHLDFAIKELREMKMRPSLERALRYKDILKA
jgi:hypothetical protein